MLDTYLLLDDDLLNSCTRNNEVGIGLGDMIVETHVCAGDGSRLFFGDVDVRIVTVPSRAPLMNAIE